MTFVKNEIGLLGHFGAGAGVVAGYHAYFFPEVPGPFIMLPIITGHLVYTGLRAITEKNLTLRRYLMDTFAFYAGVYGADQVIYRGLGVPGGNEGGTVYWPGYFGPG